MREDSSRPHMSKPNAPFSVTASTGTRPHTVARITPLNSRQSKQSNLPNSIACPPRIFTTTALRATKHRRTHHTFCRSPLFALPNRAYRPLLECVRACYKTGIFLCATSSSGCWMDGTGCRLCSQSTLRSIQYVHDLL